MDPSWEMDDNYGYEPLTIRGMILHVEIFFDIENH